MFFADNGKLDPDITSFVTTKQTFLNFENLISRGWTRLPYLIDQGEGGAVGPTPLDDHNAPVKGHPCLSYIRVNLLTYQLLKM